MAAALDGAMLVMIYLTSLSERFESDSSQALWKPSNSNGLGIDADKVNEVYQKQYYQQLMDWAEQEQVLVYFFEAFDESWKGSCDPLEPEKHWGLYRTDRSPKLVVNQNAQR